MDAMLKIIIKEDTTVKKAFNIWVGRMSKQDMYHGL